MPYSIAFSENGKLYLSHACIYMYVPLWLNIVASYKRVCTCEIICCSEYNILKHMTLYLLLGIKTYLDYSTPPSNYIMLPVLSMHSPVYIHVCVIKDLLSFCNILTGRPSKMLSPSCVR